MLFRLVIACIFLYILQFSKGINETESTSESRSALEEDDVVLQHSADGTTDVHNTEGQPITA